MTTKQLDLIKKLIDKSPYMLVVDPMLINNADASKLIKFLLGQGGRYEDFIKAIRRKGPKIPNLVGDYIYEDF